MHQLANAPILYTFRRCPYAMRARLALAASGIDYEHREVDLKCKPSQLLAISPKATVPVLWLPGSEERVIEQSLEIMLWALKIHDPNNWLPKDERENTVAMKVIQNNDTHFKEQLDKYKYPVRFGLTSEVSVQQRELSRDTLMNLEELLSKNKFLLGDKFGLIDAALAPFVRQFARVDMQWFQDQPYKRLIGWLDEFEKSTLFFNVMKKVPVWTAPNI